MLGKINSFKITQMINSKKVFIEKETKRVRTTLKITQMIISNKVSIEKLTRRVRMTRYWCPLFMYNFKNSSMCFVFRTSLHLTDTNLCVI